jgi:hypothetical protein
MANKTLFEKYKIPCGSEWKHRDAGVYIVADLKHCFDSHKIPVVLYFKKLTEEERQDWDKSGMKNQFVKTVDSFKSNFKLKETNVQTNTRI